MSDASLFQRMRHLLQNDADENINVKAEALLRKIARYFDRDAKDVMTHRRDIFAIDGDEPLDQAIKLMLEERYSRFPIYNETIDEIIGFMHLKDAMTCYFKCEDRTRPIKEFKEYIRPVKFIPETKHIDKLFKEMQAKKYHIAIIIDEYGQTFGLVTMEDILEEIVGNIMDEHDDETKEIVRCADGSYVTDGIIDLKDLEELLDIEFEKDEYETLNGFMIDKLDRIPAEGETWIVEYEGYKFTSLEVDNNAIESVKIEKINK